MTQPPLFSLVLATAGRRDELQPLLLSLQAQTERRFELVVVDQNADDRLQAPLRLLSHDGVSVLHLRQAEPLLSRARNLGLRYARGELVAFPDDDAWYEPDTLRAAFMALQERPGDDGLVAWWVDIEPTVPLRQGLVQRDEWRRFRGGEASSITLFLRARALRDWGGFDDALGLGSWYGSGEETDLLLRALAAGACLRHDASVRVRHAAPSQGAMPWRQQLRRARGTGALYAKHGLPAGVVARGMLAPLLKQPPRPAVALGRAQGLLAWTLGLARHRG